MADEPDPEEEICQAKFRKLDAETAWQMGRQYQVFIGQFDNPNPFRFILSRCNAKMAIETARDCFGRFAEYYEVDEDRVCVFVGDSIKDDGEHQDAEDVS